VETTWQALKVIAVTAGVVAAAAWAARVAGRKLSPLGRGRGPHLEVLDSLSLGIQRGVFVVRAGRQLLLLGVARDSVVLLGEMDQASLDAPPPPSPHPAGPDDQLGRRLSRRLEELRARLSPEGRAGDR